MSKKVVENGLKNWESTDMVMFQYFIDAFGKEFTFTEEHYNQIKESTIDFEDLLTQIYEEVSLI